MPVKSGGKIALTGATGFVGGHVLTHLLEQGYYVNALTRRPQQREHERLNWVAGDLANEAALKSLVDGVNGVVHMAGIIKARRHRDFVEGNVTGTWRLLNAMMDTDIADTARYVHVSSIAARKPSLSSYTRTKEQAEATVKSVGPGLDWVIIRPPAVYGPGDQETLQFFKAAKARIAVMPGSGRNRTSLIHVLDLARAIGTTLTSTDIRHQIVDVHDGSPLGYSLRDVIRMIAGPQDVPPMVFLPKFVLQGIGGTAWLMSFLTRKAPMLTPSKARELCHPNWICADRTLFNHSDWRPWINADKGLSETRIWYENEKMI
ncbi:MAG: NAD-dependent epimerase/dehydratase family protein [Proteobacteria bacterium]|nr:NAD-dependent epimerase/dehydratase family protein [Pseudomonadota bacterium]